MADLMDGVQYLNPSSGVNTDYRLLDFVLVGKHSGTTFNAS